MTKRHIDLLCVSCLALLTLGALAIGIQSGAVRMLFVLPLVFALPGYAFVEALFPAKSLAFAERMLFSLGASLMIVVLGGLLLNSLPWGLQPTPWAVLLVSITLVGCLVAMLWRPVSATQNVRPALRIPWRSITVYAVAVLIAAGSVFFGYKEAERLSQTDVIQLWMLPAANAQAVSSSAPGIGGGVQLGIYNGASQAAIYKLRLQSGAKTIQEWPALNLAANETWNMAVPAESIQGINGPIEALLYRADAPDVVYRRTVVWPSTLGK